MKEQVYSVTQVNTYIKNMFVREYVLNHIAVTGEVSNCKYHGSGHIYFTLKDKKGQLSCVMFAGNRKGLAFRLEEGQSVIVEGNISVYEAAGKYQMYAVKIKNNGEGDLYAAFEACKQKLLAEGLFEAAHKKQIAHYNKKIGIVTADTGAAIQDIINISKRRNPYISLYLYPARVQGEGAARTIIEGIKVLDTMDLDVIIVGRGGGSVEDLFAFNDEALARTIYACHTPIISAVGHETDFTIADYVADLRAPTPSAAAELAVCDIGNVFLSIAERQRRLERNMEIAISKSREQVAKRSLQMRMASVEQQLNNKRQWLVDAEERMNLRMEQKLRDKKMQIALIIEKLKGLSPLEKLQSGYAFVTDEEGQTIRTVQDVRVGMPISVSLKDGDVVAKVEEVNPLTRE